MKAKLMRIARLVESASNIDEAKKLGLEIYKAFADKAGERMPKRMPRR